MLRAGAVSVADNHHQEPVRDQDQPGALLSHHKHIGHPTPLVRGNTRGISWSHFVLPMQLNQSDTRTQEELFNQSWPQQARIKYIKVRDIVNDFCYIVRNGEMIWNVDTVKLHAMMDNPNVVLHHLGGDPTRGMAGGQGRSAQLWPGQCWLRSSDHLAVFHKYQIQRPREVARQRQLQSFKTLLRLQSHKSCISKSRCSCAQRDTEGLTEEPLVQNKRLQDWGLQHLSIDLLRRGIF